MDRTEALTLMYEVIDALSGSFFPSYVSSDADPQVVENEAANGFSIKMKCELNAECWERVKPVLDRHGYKIKVSNDFVVIYKPH